MQKICEISETPQKVVQNSVATEISEWKMYLHLQFFTATMELWSGRTRPSFLQ